MAIDPRDTNIVYAGTWHLPWKTINGGVTWKQTGNQIAGMINDSDVFGITVDPNQPNIVYVNACSGFYRSMNAGEKWYKFPGIPFSARRTYVLLPHPTNPSVIFAGTSEGLVALKRRRQALDAAHIKDAGDPFDRGHPGQTQPRGDRDG